MSGQLPIYELVTARIVDMLEAGVVPWRKPWNDGVATAFPMNMVSKREYRGINIFLLMAMGRSSRFWLSFKQAKERGGHVRKGERGTPVIFWKRHETEDRQTGEKKSVPILRYYTVFNLDQIDGIETPDAPEMVNHAFEPIDAAARIMEAMPKRPEIIHAEPRAFYRPSTDTVNLPRPGLFAQPKEYYSTAFHELVHATGHGSRLARRPSSEIRHFGDREYSQEELVAEMGSAFLCAKARIEQAVIENQAAYIGGWLNVLKGSPKMVVYAAAQAQRAADFILDVTPGESAE
ncbi:ArdC family protein [Desulfolutivibrio sp.]|uniref:ArdC family protein n=1 Tax=Desulfolutivibrio sp. TaxID=2773296 RepID=UPI002F9687A5